MIEIKQYYKLDDTGVVHGVTPITVDKAKYWNEKNYGIFFAIQEFNDSVRRIVNLKNIRSWAIDMDKESKEEQMRRIKNAPFAPSTIVESKRGYHVYWNAKDASVHNYKAILEGRLIPYYKADNNAKDVCRILRVPGYYHCKDEKDKFLIKIIEDNNLIYSEKEMLTFYKKTIKKERICTDRLKVSGDTFWHKSGSIPAEYALNRLSGSGYVNGDTFTLKNNANGSKQIWVNGKSTAAWIDIDGHIGSCNNGGPNICKWIYWYNHSWKETASIIEKVFMGDL